MKHELELAVIVPVYNEREAIVPVLDEWRQMLDSLGMRYRIAAYNDGSRDGTTEILTEYGKKHSDTVCVTNKENSGHGPTILRGYREYVEKSEWLFQIDSDNEMPAASFPLLWAAREKSDFLLGRRAGRHQPFSRKLVSMFSRLAVRLFYRASVWDVNAPYRLMRSNCFVQLFSKIPPDTFAPNVIISGFVGKEKLRFAEFDIPHTNRQTGEVSIRKWKLLKSAVRSFWQTVKFSIKC